MSQKHWSWLQRNLRSSSKSKSRMKRQSHALQLLCQSHQMRGLHGRGPIVRKSERWECQRTRRQRWHENRFFGRKGTYNKGCRSGMGVKSDKALRSEGSQQCPWSMSGNHRDRFGDRLQTGESLPTLESGQGIPMHLKVECMRRRRNNRSHSKGRRDRNQELLQSSSRQRLTDMLGHG